jgi:hypothetical protein
MVRQARTMALFADDDMGKFDLVVLAAEALPGTRDTLFGYGAHDELPFNWRSGCATLREARGAPRRSKTER